MKQVKYNPLLANEIEEHVYYGRINKLKEALKKEGAGDAVRHARFFSLRNILQMAVCCLKPQAVIAILETAAGREILNSKDGAGQTALDITYNFNAASEDLCDEIRGILEDAGAKRASALIDVTAVDKNLQSSFYSRHKLACNLLLSTAAVVIGFCAYKNPAIFSNLKDFGSKCISKLTSCVVSR